MGNVNYTVHRPVTGNIYMVRWASLSTSNGSADRGQPFPATTDFGLIGALFSDKSVHVRRPSGSDGRVIIQGSNQADEIATTSLNWATLDDPQGNALVLPGTGVLSVIEAVLENVFYVSPVVSTISSTSMAVTVDLLLTSVRSSRSGV